MTIGHDTPTHDQANDASILMEPSLFDVVPVREMIWCVSLWQPHASLMFAYLDGVRVKPDETRHWPFPPRLRGQRVMIHAAQRRVTRDEAESDLGDLCARLFGPTWAKSLPYGAHLGSVLFGDALRMSERPPLHALDELCGYWTPGRWAWRTTDPQPLAEPVIAKGQQGFWKVSAALLADGLAGHGQPVSTNEKNAQPTHPKEL